MALLDVKNIFKKTAKNDTLVQDQYDQNNLENIQVGETYEQYGTRVCGMVTANSHSLVPFLQKVYHQIYKFQCENEEKQCKERDKIQSEIDTHKSTIEKINADIENIKNRLSIKQNEKEKLEKEKFEIQQKGREINKEHRLKLIIGLVIIIPLTFYLFLFYSSTFYSAFFADASSSVGVVDKLFDGEALIKAMRDGITELCFVLSAPIIFLGLGFSLHFFSLQKGIGKWFKMVAIVLVTLFFDCILAYKIGEQIHNIKVIMGSAPLDEVYTINMAIHDINSWAVIFCGFIVYIIWGIVFDQCMDAYDKMDLNKTKLKEIIQKISNIENQLLEEKDNMAKNKQKIIDEESIIRKLEKEIQTKVFIDMDEIKKEINNFFVGWIKMMNILSKSNEDKNEAKMIYDREISTLFK